MIEDHTEDRISLLPDSILLIIMSFLTVKEVAIMCATLKRCSPLWAYIQSLNFEAPNLRREDLRDDSLVLEKRSRYINWVNQVLISHRASIIDQFSIDFYLDSSSSREIDSWLDFAIGKRVQRLDLMLTRVSEGVGIKLLYAFPEDLYNHLKTPIGLLSIQRLTSLCLRFVNVTGEIIGHFLSNCPTLQQLIVQGAQSLESLIVVGSSPPQLKHLEILSCLHLKAIDICVPNLVTFVYSGLHTTVCFRQATSLVHLSLRVYRELPFVFSSISSYSSQLVTLHLNVDLNFTEFPEAAAELTNLKQLTVAATAFAYKSLLGLLSILKAAPHLQKLELRLALLKWVDGHRRPSVILTPCRYPSLKMVEIVGFVGWKIDCEITLHLIESAIILDKLIIDRRHPGSFGTPWEFEETKEKVAAMKCALQLKAKVPAGVELSIV